MAQPADVMGLHQARDRHAVLGRLGDGQLHGKIGRHLPECPVAGNQGGGRTFLDDGR